MQVSLSAVVIGVEHGSQFTDSKTRALFRIEEADCMWRNLRLPIDGFQDVPALGAKYNLVLAPAVEPAEVAK